MHTSIAVLMTVSEIVSRSTRFLNRPLLNMLRITSGSLFMLARSSCDQLSTTGAIITLLTVLMARGLLT